jgi:hypothetical protein
VRTEQTTFLKHVGLVVIVLITASTAIHELKYHWSRRSLALAERRAAVLRTEARSLLRDTTVDASQRIAGATVFLEEAEKLLSDASTQYHERNKSASILPSLFSNRSSSGQPHSLYADIATTRVTLGWLQNVFPALDRLAGYDASADIASSGTPDDIRKRLYLAREGLRYVDAALDAAPPHITAPLFTDLRNAIRGASDAATTAIRSIEVGGNIDIELRVYLADAKRAALLAHTLSADIAENAMTELLQ